MKTKQKTIILLVLLNAALCLIFLYQKMQTEQVNVSNEILAEFDEEQMEEFHPNDIQIPLVKQDVGSVIHNAVTPAPSSQNLKKTQTQKIDCNCGGNLTRHEICKNGIITKLESFSSEEAAEFYDRMMMNIQKPAMVEFLQSSDNVHLEIVLMEMKNSESKWLLPAIYNIANVYAKENVAFTIAHHAFHAPVLNSLKNNFKNLRLIQLAQGPFNIQNYSALLSSLKFWVNFKANFTLITQSDVMIIKPLEKEFYQYDLIGAPWPHKPCTREHQVGNGGYTLRNTSKMKEVLGKESNDGTVPEDVWWCERVENTPTVEFAKQFAVELFEIGHVPPTAGHQMDRLRGSFNSGGEFFRQFQKVNNISVC
jgi:Protein of unknown function (DUF5672)